MSGYSIEPVMDVLRSYYHLRLRQINDIIIIFSINCYL